MLNHDDSNLLYRTHSNQQQLLLAQAPRLKDGDWVTSYGCGQGLFEIDYLRGSGARNLHFRGCDPQAESLEKIETELTALRQGGIVDCFELQHSGLEDVSWSPVGIALAIHSLYWSPDIAFIRFLNEMLAYDVCYIAMNESSGRTPQSATTVRETVGQRLSETQTECCLHPPQDLPLDSLRGYVSFVTGKSQAAATREQLEATLQQVGYHDFTKRYVMSLFGSDDVRL